MKLTFFGAARTVTGSKHMVTDCNGTTLLLDCGMFQGKELDVDNLNKELGFNPADIDVVLLSHAHIDHSGLLPFLVKNGFNGTIFCTVATKDLAEILLLDSVKIQENDAKWARKEQERNPDLEIDVPEPLYSEDDVETTLRMMKAINYNNEIEVSDDMVATFVEAGHILGSSVIKLVCKSSGQTLVFTGDLGRKGLPILRDPAQVEAADIVISESTYGGRSHEDSNTMEEGISKAVQDIVRMDGKLIIPAFSIGRTQEVIYLLHKLYDEGRIPQVPIYVDSPLATDATEIFMRHPEIYDMETFETFLHKQQHPFSFKTIHYTQSVEESKKLNQLEGAAIIVSASGMAEGGRVVHHLKNNLSKDSTIVLFIGYQAKGTLGRELLEGAEEVEIHSKPVEVHAEMRKLNAFSAHADQDELYDYLQAIKGVKDIFLVHGEYEQQETMAERLRNGLPGVKVHIPERFEEFDV